MSDQKTNNGELATAGHNVPAQSEQTHEANTKTLRTLADAAGLVQKYAAKLLGNERAAQFATHISVMAQKNPKIRECAPESVVTAMMACVALDLMPNTPEQYAHLIPYGRDLQFQLGYQGILELVSRTGKVEDLNAELVFEGDKFQYSLGTNRSLVHEPDMNVDRTDYSKVVAAYTTIELNTGKIKFDVMTRTELDKVRNTAKAKSTDAPWATWPEQMAKKTSVKRALKYMPKSKEDNRLTLAAQIDSWAEAGKLRINHEGQIIEGETIDREQQTRRQIAAAEAKHQAFKNSSHTPAAVETKDNGQE